MTARKLGTSLLLIAALATPCFARVKLVLMPQRENVRLHFEASAPVLMEEERVIALEEGVNQVELAWEGLPILPQSILFDPIEGAESLTTLAVSTPPSGQSALIWWVKAAEAGNYRMRISYALGGGIALERTDYSARADAEETSIEVSGKSRLYNGSGLDQNDLRVEIGVAPPTATALARDERRDVVLLEKAPYPLTKTYVSDARVENGRVQLIYEWTVPLAAAPQLAGKARAFLATGGTEQGQLDTFLGESWLAYVPRGEKCKLFVGFANNIEVERQLIQAQDEDIVWTKVPEGSDRQPDRVLWNTRRVWKIKLKNHTANDLTVRLTERGVGEWVVIGDLQPTKVEDAGTIHFDIPVAKGEEKEVTYTIVQRNIEPGEPTL